MFLRLIPLGVLCALTGFGTHPVSAIAAAESTALSAAESVLTLEEALARTLRTNPNLTVATEERSAAEAEHRRAGRLPNPELTVTLENVAGEGAYQDTDAAELTIALSQPVELGGKRHLRREAAELGRQLAANGEQLTRIDVLATTRQRYIAVQAAQEGLVLAKEQATLAGKSLAAAEERIKAGKAPQIDRLRLQGEASMSLLAVAQAERALETSSQALAACWGGSSADFIRVNGEFSQLPELPALTDIEVSLEQTPEATNRHLATELRSNELAQARARRIPDPSLTVGWRQFEESDENAWLFGVSFPLPLFNQGQDELVAANSRLNGAKARELNARTQAQSSLRSAWYALANAKAEAEVLGNQVVPAAVEGFAAADFGYRAGKFGLIELLDAQKALFEARQRQFAAQVACHLAAIELQRLQGIEAGAATR
jgi:cobalt-zinc-cadmium efflux system outer membrane protein